jgi:hypothetical protein
MKTLPLSLPLQHGVHGHRACTAIPMPLMAPHHPTHTHTLTSCLLSLQASQPGPPLLPTSPTPPLPGLPPLTITNHDLKARVFGLSQRAPHLASATAFQDQLDRF